MNAKAKCPKFLTNVHIQNEITPYTYTYGAYVVWKSCQKQTAATCFLSAH